MGPAPSTFTGTAESILVYGGDDLATAVVAVALARRHVAEFAWADCAPLPHPPAVRPRSWVERFAGPPLLHSVDETVLRPTNHHRLALHRLVTPTHGSEDLRLLNYLAMPELFQRLAAQAIRPEGRGVVLLDHIDDLPTTTVANTLGTSRLHQTLHEEGVTMVVVSRTAPPEATARVFDRCFCVEVPAGAPWDDGWLTERTETAHRGEAVRSPLLAMWDRLGLEHDLLVARPQPQD